MSNENVPLEQSEMMEKGERPAYESLEVNEGGGRDSLLGGERVKKGGGRLTSRRLYSPWGVPWRLWAMIMVCWCYGYTSLQFDLPFFAWCGNSALLAVLIVKIGNDGNDN